MMSQWVHSGGQQDDAYRKVRALYLMVDGKAVMMRWLA